ncbi:MAG: AGE family epimerase/isomerase [Acidobacteriota bacterium]
MNSLTLDHEQIYAQYKALLLDDVVPFWLNNGIDWKYGGVLSCIRDDGSLISGDKFMWSQARSVWTFAALYNRVEKRPEFLAAAENSIRFLLEHGRDTQGQWIYHADQQGREIEGATSIYTDCFVIYGFSEYYRAVRDEQILSIARETLERVCQRIEEPDFQETAPYPLPLGWKNHGIPMILTETINEFILTTGETRLEVRLDDYVARIMDHFVRPDKKVLLEFLTTDYRELPAPAGTFVMPGHAIESMWFVLHVARRRGDQGLIRRAAEVIRWHLEYGWDPEYGGLCLSRDIEGHPPYLPHSDKKLWWPHVEALYSTLLAHQLTGESWCLEWYQRVADWAWSHFPTRNGGDWMQRLTREGTPTTEVIALPVKDPFHLPRGAMLILQLMHPSLLRSR